MEKEGARKQTLEQSHERRKQVVRLHKKGIRVIQIVTITGLSYPAVRGDWRYLIKTQEEAIRRTINDQRQEQLKMNSLLWSRSPVEQLIEQEFDIKLKIPSVENT